MTVESQQDLEGLKRAGRAVARTLNEMSKHVRPGITTRELDAIGARELARCGAQSAPQLTYDFPGATCISINEQAAHGIPGDRIILPGDSVNIDVSAELDGYWADTAATYLVPPFDPLKRRLVECVQRAMRRALRVARAGQPLNRIGATVELTAHDYGFQVLRNLPGHGLGRSLHEEPTVLNFYHPRFDQPLTEGLVITIEPFISASADHVVDSDDGWTLSTADGSLAAQFEHTIVITKNQPLIMTAVVNV